MRFLSSILVLALIGCSPKPDPYVKSSQSRRQEIIDHYDIVYPDNIVQSFINGDVCVDMPKELVFHILGRPDSKRSTGDTWYYYDSTGSVGYRIEFIGYKVSKVDYKQ